MNKQTTGGHHEGGENLVFEQDNLWYFRNSEGAQVGPFRYAKEAQSNLDQLLQSIRESIELDRDKERKR